MRRWIGLVVALVVLMSAAGAPAMAKQNVAVELFYNGVWNDHTGDLDKEPISINHAAGSEQGGVVPTDGKVRFKNPDGRMNPDNPRGPLFGLIGEKTPIRVKVAGDIRISGRAVKWQPRRSLGGSKYVSWVDVTIGGKVRELGQGEPPVRSALYRTIQREAKTKPLLAYWSFEELIEADQFGSGIPGGLPMKVPANVLASNDGTLPGSKALPTFTHNVPEQGRGLINVVALSGSSMTWDVWVKTPITGEYFDANLYTEGPSGRHWHLTVDNVGRVDLFYYDSGSSGATTPIVSDPQAMGVWHNIRFTMTQNGGNIDCVLIFDGVSIATGSTAGTVTAPNQATLEAAFTATEAEKNNIGHMTVWDGIPSKNFYQAGLGYPGELAGDRFNRIGVEEGITTTVVGLASDTQPMGPQYPDTTLALLGEIAATDAGIIYDTRSQEGLTFRTGRSLYNQ